MTHAWRLIQQNFAAGAFSGESSRQYGGRWNHKGVPVVYVSGTLSLAALELFVHIGLKEITQPYLSFHAAIPDDMRIECVDAGSLPAGWHGEPAPESTRDIGLEWFRSSGTAVLRVPSIIIPTEFNYVLNPGHPDFGRIEIGPPEPFRFDTRMCK